MSKETGKPEIDYSRMKCVRRDQQRNLTEQVAVELSSRGLVSETADFEA